MSNRIYIGNSRFAIRSDSLENWTNINPILADGEPSHVNDATDSKWFKVGDGVTPWIDLPYKKWLDLESDLADAIADAMDMKMDKFGTVENNFIVLDENINTIANKAGTAGIQIRSDAVTMTADDTTMGIIDDGFGVFKNTNGSFSPVRFTGVAIPNEPFDAANKKYVDDTLKNTVNNITVEITDGTLYIKKS